MTREIRISSSPGEHRIALLEGGRVVEFRLHRPHAPDGVGALVAARILTHTAALAGAFCALPDGTTGFLPDSDAKHLPKPARSEGALLPLRLVRAAQGRKGPRLTARLTAAESALAQGHTGPALLRPAPHPALTLAARHNAPILTDSLALAATLRATPLHTPAFDDELEAEFDAACAPTLALPGGGTLTITPTPALTAIDIDSGAAGPAVNAAALAETARQIRLRDLAGAILIDPAGLTAKTRAALAPAFAAALDPLARFIGITGLGLFEVQRARLHPPLHELMAGPLPLALAALRAAAREAHHRPGARLALRAAPSLIEAAAPHLPTYRAETGTTLALNPDPAEPRFTIEPAP